MAICMKLSPHVCEDDSCVKASVRKGRETTVLSMRVPDAWAQKIKRLANNHGEGTVNSYLCHIIEARVMKNRSGVRK